MTRIEKLDKVAIGVITGFFLPLVTVLIFYLFSSEKGGIVYYFKRIIEADILTHVISLCVLPNLIVFLILNRLDMLRATRGVLGITIFWAAVVFAVKFFV
jgi:hypothetical protein